MTNNVVFNVLLNLFCLYEYKFCCSILLLTYLIYYGQTRLVTMANGKDFTFERMVNWYKSASPTFFEIEIIISSESSATDSITFILEQ